MVIQSLEAFGTALAQAQEERADTLHLMLSPALAARLTDAAVAEAVVTGLPMAQGIRHAIQRSRGRGALLRLKIRYREGVRIMDSLQGRPVALTEAETSALEKASEIVRDIMGLPAQEERFQAVVDWICRSITYAHTSPGRKGYEQLVGVCGALAEGRANCQGFAAVLYLLCGLCGIGASYRCARGVRQLHVWNAVCIDGTWREADVSKAARINQD